MFIPIIALIILFGMGSLFIHTQEKPPVEMTEEEYAARKNEIEQSQEFKDLALANMAIGNFRGNNESEEFKTLVNDLNEKQDAFNRKFTSSEQEPEQNVAEEAPTESVNPDAVQTENVSTEETEEKAETSAEKNTTPEETPVESETEAPTQETTSTENIEKLEEPIVVEEATTNESAIPVAPKIEEQETTIPEDPVIIEEPVGIDTVSLEHPQGNWLFKRIWWERAEERYERIRFLVDAIWESRNTFFHERNKLDRTVLDPFYITIGIDKAELQIILSEINDFLEKQRDQQDSMTEQERMLYETYTTEEDTLKQLQKDVDLIANLDHAIDDALGTFMNQINRVRNYEAEAWKNFKEIAHILNDTKARELYYMIEGAARNIKTINTYLEQEFFTHFHKLINETKTRVSRVQNQMESLKEKGVIFQRQAEQLQELSSSETENPDTEDEQESKPKPKVGWFDWLFSGISTAIASVWSIIRLPYDLVFGK